MLGRECGTIASCHTWVHGSHCAPASPHTATVPTLQADPSYMIRSIPTTTTDRIYCKVPLPAKIAAVACRRCLPVPPPAMPACHACLPAIFLLLPAAAAVLPAACRQPGTPPSVRLLPGAGPGRGARRVCGVHRLHCGLGQHVSALPCPAVSCMCCALLLGPFLQEGVTARMRPAPSCLMCRHYVYLPTTTIIQFARTVDPCGKQPQKGLGQVWAGEGRTVRCV